jgi:hypothetical protein
MIPKTLAVERAPYTRDQSYDRERARRPHALIRDVDLRDLETAGIVRGQIVRLCQAISGLIGEDEVVGEEGIERLHIASEHGAPELHLHRFHLIGN